MAAISPARAIACVVLTLGLDAAQSQTPATPALDFTLEALAGDSITLSTLKSHPVLLNFWATWCTPCRADMRDLVDAIRLTPRRAWRCSRSISPTRSA